MKIRVPFLASILLLCSFMCNSIEDEVMCLEGVKDSLSDPTNKLSSWTFTNTSATSICKLQGVTCWTKKEVRLLSLEMPSMQLAGGVPLSLKYCRSLQNLDLSGNALSGPIPPQICQWLPYLVTLNLSSNKLSGPIPPEIANCTFLNSLFLSDNRLSGPIPSRLGDLLRLMKFSVANNDLSGSVPSNLGRLEESDFDGSNGLCGEPLRSKCGGLSSKSIAIIVTAGISGATGSLLLVFFCWRFFLRRRGEK